LTRAIAWPTAAWTICALHAQGLGDFTTAGGVPTCNGARQPTPSVAPASYKPNAPTRSSLREAGVAGTALTLSGAVIGLRCGAIKDAAVEFWQADAAGHYDDAGFRLRAQARTDAKGTFQFDTVMPGAPAGRARRLNLRVTPPGKPALTTAIFFPDDALRTTDPAFKPDLVMKADPGDRSRLTFDVVFDL
jgi:protocatechuate 3,4-dioxygenase beta subunit